MLVTKLYMLHSGRLSFKWLVFIDSCCDVICLAVTPLRKSTINFILIAGDHNKNLFVTRSKLLIGYISGSHHMPFVVPMVQRQPKYHSCDCYFCFTNKRRISSKPKHTLKYPSIPLSFDLFSTVMIFQYQTTQHQMI